MVGFGTSVSRPIYGRGPSPGLRFTVYALLCFTLMYLDQRAGWSERIRYGLEAAAYPVQVAVNSPAATWRWLTSSFATRSALRRCGSGPVRISLSRKKWADRLRGRVWKRSSVDAAAGSPAR